MLTRLLLNLREAALIPDLQSDGTVLSDMQFPEFLSGIGGSVVYGVGEDSDLDPLDDEWSGEESDVFELSGLNDGCGVQKGSQQADEETTLRLSGAYAAPWQSPVCPDA